MSGEKVQINNSTNIEPCLNQMSIINSIFLSKIRSSGEEYQFSVTNMNQPTTYAGISEGLVLNVEEYNFIPDLFQLINGTSIAYVGSEKIVIQMELTFYLDPRAYNSNPPPPHTPPPAYRNVRNLSNRYVSRIVSNGTVSR